MITAELNKSYDELPFIEKRHKFLNWLLMRRLWDVEKIPIKDKIARACHRSDYVLNYVSPIVVNEQHRTDKEDSFEKDERFDGMNFNPSWNTRRVQPTEIIIEFDNEFQIKNIRWFYDTAINLIQNKIHFVVFYAVGMKCPHIRIYDLLPEDLDDDIAKEVRLIFARSVVPMDAMSYLDKGLLSTGHKCQLEFAKHWKYNSMFKLMAEHLPSFSETNGEEK
jgi:hypothetical protein